MIGRRALRIALMLPLLAACGDDGTSPNTLTPEEVAGIYAICSLTFDPEGDLLTTVDIVDAAFETDNAQVTQPQLRLNSNKVFEIVYTPEDQFVTETIRGTYTISGSQVVLTFTQLGTTVDPKRLLLPTKPALGFQEAPKALTIASAQSYDVLRADYARLAGVSEAGLAEQIPGRLTGSFSASGC